MIGTAFHRIVPVCLSLVVWLCLASVAMPQADDVPPAPEPAEVDEAELEKVGSSASFTLPRNQSMIQCVELLRESVNRKDFLGALPLMERVLTEPNSFVPVGASTEVAAHEEVRRLLRQLPGDMRRRLDEQRQVTARREWEQVSTSGITDVIAFAQRYGDLPIGVDVLWWIARYENDHGRHRLAASAFMRMADHPYATTIQRVVALMANFDCLRASSQTADALSVRNLLSKFDPGLSIEVAGRSLTIRDWLAQHPPSTDAARTIEQPTDAANLIADRLRRPVLPPTWKHQFSAALPSGLVTGWATHEQRQRDQGLRPIPILRPVIAGDLAIVRTLHSVQAARTSNGQAAWSIPNIEYRQIEKMNLFGNGAYQTATIDWAQRRTHADSIFGRMSTNGDRLFVIQEPDRTREFRIDREFPRVMHRNGPQYNKLCSYSLSNGSLEWEIGGPATGASDTYGGYFFLGCPLVLDDMMYAVAQREMHVDLLAIDPASSSLKWSLELGTVALPIMDDLQRSRVACPIVWHEGLLLCSTSAGAVVAVDPLLRSLQWSYRYPAMTISAGDLVQGQNPSNIHLDREPWWDSWREPFMSVWHRPANANGAAEAADNHAPAINSVLVFASPESDHLHAIRLPDGELIWRSPRAGGMVVVQTVEDLVIVIEGDFLRAHEIATGRQRWRTMIGEVSGSGAITGSVLVLPAQSGGTILVNIHNGQLLSDSTGVDSPLGTLTEVQSGWLAANTQGVMLLPPLANVRKQVEQQLQNEPDSESLRVRAALLDLQAGDPAAAQGRLQGLQSSPARELRRQALIDALKDPATGADRSELARQLKDLAEDVDYKFAAGAAIGTSALAVVDLAAAVDAALEGLTADLDQSEALVKTTSVSVRKDRVLLGLIDEAYRRAKPEDIAMLDELFLNRLRDARKSRDRFAVQRLAHQWRGLDWGRKLTVNEDERVFRKRPPAEIELLLLDAAGSADSSIGLQALDKLAQRLSRPATSSQAREIRQRILREFSSARFPDGSTESERITRDARLRGEVYDRPAAEWPSVAPEVQSLDDRNYQLHPIVPVHAEPGSLAEHLDVLVDRNGAEVIFRGGAFYQSGQDDKAERKLVLPPNPSPYRSRAGYMLREGWGIGRVVVLVVGTELFAISPMDENGEPNPRFLWSNPIQLQWSSNEVRIVAGRPNVNDGRRVAVDQSNRPIGRVGPVRAGYLCYQKGPKLIAVETETGRALWERLDLPKDVTVLGDDHRVYLWRESKVVEVLSAIDGRLIEERVVDQLPSKMIHHRGQLAWTVKRDSTVRTELHDFGSQQLLWSRNDPAGTYVTVLDPETLGVATPQGQLHLLAARTGTALCAPLTVNAEGLSGITTWCDAERWYVALMRPTRSASKLRMQQPNDSYRLKFVRGMLYAIDREQPRIQWDREMKDEPISLDQSRTAPVLVQMWKTVPRDDRSPLEGALRIIDKRTGKTLVDKTKEGLNPYFLLNPDRQQGILDVKLDREMIRLVYGSDQPADALEATAN